MALTRSPTAQASSAHGLRPFVQYSNYAVSAKGDATEIINQIVRDMWLNAHLYENGVVQLAGTKEAIPVGTNISLEERGWLGHVEQVENHFSVLGSGMNQFRTSVAFSRLHTLIRQGGTTKAIPVAPGDPMGATIGDWDRGAGFHSFGSSLDLKDPEPSVDNTPPSGASMSGPFISPDGDVVSSNLQVSAPMHADDGFFQEVRLVRGQIQNCYAHDDPNTPRTARADTRFTTCSSIA
jgi:hypothetical protein